MHNAIDPKAIASRIRGIIGAHDRRMIVAACYRLGLAKWRSE